MKMLSATVHILATVVNVKRDILAMGMIVNVSYCNLL